MKTRLVYTVKERRWSRAMGFYQVQYQIPVRYIMAVIVLVAAVIVIT